MSASRSSWHEATSRLRSGAWLTPERMRGYCLILLVIGLAGFAVWIAMSDGLVDRNNKPIGTDFSNPYAAGVLVLEGRAADAYDPALLHAAEKAVFGGRDVPFFGWHYPPFFFAIAALVALLPYAGGLLLWLGTSLAGYLAVIHAIVPRRETWLAALAFPGVLITIGHGQNAFFTAALLGGAMLVLNSRPILAGVLIGLLVYKPQFGLLIPLALLAGGYWVTIAAAAATVLALIAASTLVFGVDIWLAFYGSTKFTQTVVLEQGTTGWEKIQSMFSAARMWGAGVPTAYLLQGLLTVTVAIGLIWLWRSRSAFDFKAAALATACLLATPYVLDYDLMVLSVAIAFLVRQGLARGFGDYEVTLLAAAWLVPLLTRSIAGTTGLPLGLIVTAVLFAATLRRAWQDLAVPQHAVA